MMSDTIAAIATPLGEGGLGVIRVSGPQAIEITKEIFDPAKPINLTHAPSHTCYFGTIKGEGYLIDQVIATLFRAPHSYTGEDVVEISAHGSPFGLKQILALSLRLGARLAGPGEFTERAFLNGKLDLTQAEAVADLIHAKTERSHAAAMVQLEGRLAAQVRRLRDTLLPLLARIEVGLDHSDEGHPIISGDELAERCHIVQKEIQALLRSAPVGKVLRHGFRVALVGRPNVGKSSLLNMLLHEERAIVTPIPGTTRDTLEETLDWDGIPVVLTDTAGIRRGKDAVERLGILRTKKAVEQSDLILAIFDGSEELTVEDQDVIVLAQGRPHLWVMNKCDLPALCHAGVWENPARRGLVEIEAVHVSAKTGEGLPELIKRVKQLALQGQATAGEAMVAINTRHQAALERAHEALARASEASCQEAFEECVALELQAALRALGEIIGETATEDLLGEIFSKFCVGK